MSFSDHGIIGRTETKDGQRFFDMRLVKADDIINCPITVVDFISDIKTREGDGRYVVHIKFQGNDCKFITNSMTLKSMLDQGKKAKVFPVDTVMRKRDLGCGKKDYSFD